MQMPSRQLDVDQYVHAWKDSSVWKQSLQILDLLKAKLCFFFFF